MMSIDKFIIYIAYTFIIFTIIASSESIILLSCKMQKFISNNYLFKNLINLLMIFGIVMMEGINDETSWSNTNPFQAMLITIIIFIAFILFSKIQLNFALCVIILLFILYVTITYKNNLKFKNLLKIDIENYINIITNILVTLLIIVSLVGFIKYYIYKKNKHKNNFSIIKFFFGINKC